ncbi:protein translocase subunit SecD [Motilibacter deserti]|uniref:Multifunctional fusion protein n=1 Tax=Motilibacter deserti TaxID=2714956 RepID=A0ABX0GUP2_9ACTN|nr:protein translocase subunit SecD [Motilibacter deserti]
MSRARAVRAVLALLVLAAAAFLAFTREPRLGLDLRGGTQIVLETKSTDTVEAGRDTTDRALEVLRRRVDALGVAEPSLTRSGDTRILVELPGLTDATDAADVLGRTAQLTVHPVLGLAEQPAATPNAEATPSGTATPTAEPSPSGTATSAAPTSAPSAATDAAAPTAGATGTAATPTPTPSSTGKQAEGELTLPDESGAQLRLGPAALTGEGISDSAAQLDGLSGTSWVVTIDFNGAGDDAWKQVTADAACQPDGSPQRRIAIVLDDAVISSPQVETSVACGAGIAGGSTQITGSFTANEAKDLAALVKGGALPVPVEVIEQRTVGPTLGDEAIEASWKAALLGLAGTALFVIVVYRLLGLLATLALLGYALIAYAALVALGATLTLPGLAGFVLAIGMAVDANVLTFERAREEYAQAPRRGLRAALVGGFRGSWSAILDSNVTTVLAAGLLFALASGPVRGFGVTLVIGVVASMFSALIVTRVLAEWAVVRRGVRDSPMRSGIGSLGRARTYLLRRDPDVLRSAVRRRGALVVSAVLVVLAAAGIGLRGLDLGVEFTGGRLVEYSTAQPLDVDEARSIVADAGFPRAVVQESDAGITVRTGELSNVQEQELARSLEAAGGTVTKERDELIGPSLGEELQRKALIALVLALAAQLVYLAVRFRWTFAASAVTAMFHDVLLVVGLFAWLGKPIDAVFLAALLTVIGYSVNDKVVVFDRVREAWRAFAGRREMGEVMNTAVLQTVPRTINTGAGVLFVLAALAVLGGDSLTDFAVALLAGVVVGTWSSVFTASPLAAALERQWPAPLPARKPVERRSPQDSGAVV